MTRSSGVAFTMFVRVRTTPNSPRKSVQLAESIIKARRVQTRAEPSIFLGEAQAERTTVLGVHDVYGAMCNGLGLDRIIPPRGDNGVPTRRCFTP